MNKHTGGIWKIEGTTTSEIIIHSNGKQIAFMSVQNKDTEANAKLIVAAPELLNSAIRIIESKSSVGERDAIELLKAAIKKATE